MTASIVAAVGFWVTAFVGVLALAMARYPTTRYQDPQLHSGVWELDRRHSNTTVHRARYGVGFHPDTSPGHRHRPHVCTITDSLVHVDECACGAERYGVYGAWS